MSGFVKVSSQILDSTIWDQPWNVKGVWITMLAMADRYGNIVSSIPGLARRATVTIEECEAALTVFLSPDKYSKTPEQEGRRIEVIDGGWHLINYAKYRNMRDEDSRREYQRNWVKDRRHKASNVDTESRHVDSCLLTSTQAEAEANSTPLPPKGERRQRRNRESMFAAYPEAICEITKSILAQTPREDVDGRLIRTDPALLIERLDALVSSNGSITPDLLLRSWVAYVHSKPAHLKAPQYFFGDKKDNGDGANWHPFARLLWHGANREQVPA